MTVMSNIEAKNAKKEKTFERFHKITINGLLWVIPVMLVKITINGLLWVIPVMLVLTAARNLDWGYQDGIGGYPLVIISSIILFASAILLVKARFDLKKMRILGVKELLIAGLAVAVAFFIDWRIDYEYGSMVEHTFMYPMIAAFWSIYFYSYYMTFSNKLTD